jgi:hypothetical protein
MTRIDLRLDGDGCWPDIDELGKTGKLDEAAITGVALLPDATVQRPDGSIVRMPCVTIRVALPHGRVGLAQIKVDMLRMIVGAIDGHLHYLADLAGKGGTPS